MNEETIVLTCVDIMMRNPEIFKIVNRLKTVIPINNFEDPRKWVLQTDIGMRYIVGHFYSKYSELMFTTNHKENPDAQEFLKKAVIRSTLSVYSNYFVCPTNLWEEMLLKEGIE